MSILEENKLLDEREEAYKEIGLAKRNASEAIRLLTDALDALERGKTHVVVDHLERAIDIIRSIRGDNLDK